MTAIEYFIKKKVDIFTFSIIINELFFILKNKSNAGNN
jgi:hypothetical protein